MTGTFTQQKAVVNTYVLQNQEGKVGFYKVIAGSEPTIKPYRAYINADVAEANIVALLLPGIETGINGIVAERGMGVFNGDLGMIRSINPYTEVITVEFEEGKFADYTFKQADELELAYATTIHKAQGSEYPAVVIPLLGGPRMLMTRNLLYTAVTRARKCVTIVGSDVTFQAMIGNHIEANRYTTLARRIREMQEENA